MPKYVPKKCTFPPGRSGYPSSSWLLGSPQSTSQFKFFYGLGVYVTHFAPARQIWRRPVKPLLRYCDFCEFQDGDRYHLGFSRIRKLHGQSAVNARCASACQISSKSLKRLRFNGFQNGGRQPPCSSMFSSCLRNVSFGK